MVVTAMDAAAVTVAPAEVTTLEAPVMIPGLLET